MGDPSVRKKAAVLLIVAGVILGGITIVRAALWPSVEEEMTPGSIAAAAAAHDPAQNPASLFIPSIGVSAEVVEVGIAKSGNMAVPRSYSQVGWYRYGPQPGEQGSAVMDGHVDNGFGLSAVFKRLAELKPGSDIYVGTASGERRHFRVESIESYLATEVPVEQVFKRADKPRLNLITCTGDWDALSKSYDHRIVVYAVYVGS